MHKLGELAVVLKWLHESGHTRIGLEKTRKSAAFRISTPEIKMSSPFETWRLPELDLCFEVIQELADIAGMFAIIDSVILKNQIIINHQK